MTHITVDLPDDVAKEYYAASEKLSEYLANIEPQPSAQTLMRFMLEMFSSEEIAMHFDFALRNLTGAAVPDEPDVWIFSPEPENQSPAVNEERGFHVNPAIDEKLMQFMTTNPKMADYYTQLVRENPERAVRSLMLSKMLRQESQMQPIKRQIPYIKQWVEQTPGMMERITERIKNVNPLYQEKAFFKEAMKAKRSIDFSQR